MFKDKYFITDFRRDEREKMINCSLRLFAAVKISRERHELCNYLSSKMSERIAIKICGAQPLVNKTICTCM